jgi:hypothetical protein
MKMCEVTCAGLCWLLSSSARLSCANINQNRYHTGKSIRYRETIFVCSYTFSLSSKTSAAGSNNGSNQPLLPSSLLPKFVQQRNKPSTIKLVACLRLTISVILDVGHNFLQPTAHSVCLFLPLPGSFSTQNSPQIGEFRVENPRFLGG